MDSYEGRDADEKITEKVRTHGNFVKDKHTVKEFII